MIHPIIKHAVIIDSTARNSTLPSFQKIDEEFCPFVGAMIDNYFLNVKEKQKESTK
jgi:hypothetical protein